jgi:hypothetical protein
MPLKAKLYFRAASELLAGLGVFIIEDTGFVSSATFGRNKTAADETIFRLSRRHGETADGY